MQEHFGSDPRDIRAAIGPGIGKCCFEVGPEVAAHFGRGERCYIDLREINRAQLAGYGIRPENMDVADLCTRCRDSEFHSYRRDGEAAGRMYSFAEILAQMAVQ